MPKIVDHEKCRREILEKCVDIFFARGYSALTLKEIAGELNLSIGTFYYYFPSKQSLFEALFRMVSEKSLRDLEERLQPAESRREKLRILIEGALTRPSLLQKQIVLSVDLMRNTVPTQSDRLNPEWAGSYLRLLGTHLGIKQEEAQVLLTYLAGLIYSSYILPSRRVQKNSAEVFLELLSLSPVFQ